MAERCPLCGGKLCGNICGECGYELPDLDKISKLYDFEPENYPDIGTEKANEVIFPPKVPVMCAEPEPVKKIEVASAPAPPPSPVRQSFPQYNRTQQYAGQSRHTKIHSRHAYGNAERNILKVMLIVVSFIFPLFGINMLIFILIILGILFVIRLIKFFRSL